MAVTPPAAAAISYFVISEFSRFTHLQVYDMSLQGRLCFISSLISLSIATEWDIQQLARQMWYYRFRNSSQTALVSSVSFVALKMSDMSHNEHQLRCLKVDFISLEKNFNTCLRLCWTGKNPQPFFVCVITISDL